MTPATLLILSRSSCGLLATLSNGGSISPGAGVVRSVVYILLITVLTLSAAFGVLVDELDLVVSVSRILERDQ